ncbi:hypothetical protein [Myxosarcina sp. GI1]|nr:hypothetical protein [Myxosarcina sp. GI1]
METDYLLNILFIAAVVLLGIVSLGIVYLSAAQWRDRRRRKRDERGF